MGLVSENPFRLLGLPANASDKDIHRQLAMLNAYMRVGRKVETDFDLDFLGDLNRDENSVRDAASMIERPETKAEQALLWFLKVSHLDETALRYIRAGQSDKAVAIWEKAVTEKEITKRNFSAALNLSTLWLFEALESRSNDSNGFVEAVRLKGTVLNSTVFSEFARVVLGNGVVIDKGRVMHAFATMIQSVVKRDPKARKRVTPNELLGAFSTFPVAVQKKVIDALTHDRFKCIEEAVKKAASDRMDDPYNAVIYGDDLFAKAADHLKYLKTLLSSDHPKVSRITNLLAEEVLQCSVTFFNYHCEHKGLDPGDDALRLLEAAKSLSPTGAVARRIEENAPTLQSWVRSKGDRDLLTLLNPEMDVIVISLEELRSGLPTIEDVNRIVRNCQQALSIIKTGLASNLTLYTEFSDAVIIHAMGLTVSAVNEVQSEAFGQSDGYHAVGGVMGLKKTLQEASNLFKLLATMDMSPAIRDRFETNSKTLFSIMRDLGMKTPSLPRSGQISTQRKAGPRFATVPDGGALGNLSRSFLRFIFYESGELGIFVAMVIGVAAILLSTLVLSSLLPESPPPTNQAVIQPQPPEAMVYVPTTTYRMGRDTGGHIIERPSHSVTVKAFFIDINEVTNEEYFEYYSKVSGIPKPHSWGGQYSTDKAKYPVTGLSYEDASGFASWKGKRLPTEAEWELAASGEEGWLYPWGNTWEKLKVNADKFGKSTVRSGLMPSVSPFGLRDMIGNAWEWTSSELKPYPGGYLPKEYAGKKGLKAVRGGSFSTPAEFATTKYRIGWPVGREHKNAEIGFRCAMDIPEARKNK